MSHRIAFSEFRFVVCAGFALTLIAAFDPASVQARAVSAASLPSIVHAPADNAVSSASAHAISGLAFDDPLAPAGSVWSGQKVVVDGAQGDFFGWSVAIDGHDGARRRVRRDLERPPAAGRRVRIHRSERHLDADRHADRQRWPCVRHFRIGSLDFRHRRSDRRVPIQRQSWRRVRVHRLGPSGRKRRKLAADDGAANDCLGWSIAVANGTILAGAPFAIIDGLQRGAVYSFAPTDGVWASDAESNR